MPKEFARQLLAHVATSGKPGDAKRSLAFRACESLRPALGKLLGVAGFRSLLSRALSLACLEVSWLCPLQITAAGSLEGLDELEAKLEARGVAEGEAALVAQLLGLLLTFLGRALTLGLVRETWPHADCEDADFGK